MNYKVKFSLNFLLVFVIQSCASEIKSSDQKIAGNETGQSTVNLRPDDTTFSTKNIYQSNYLSVDNVRVNGQKLLLTKAEFEKLHPTIDSSKTEIWECGDPFEWLDEQWMIKTYGSKNSEGIFENYKGEVTTIFHKKAVYTTNGHVVLFDKAFVQSNTVKIVSAEIVLDKKTTLEQFLRMFPNARIEKTDHSDECRVRFYLNDKSDDAFLLYFKDDRLNYITLWWLLC